MTNAFLIRPAMPLARPRPSAMGEWFGLKQVTLRVQPDVYFELENAARPRKAGPWASWLVEQLITLEFLSPADRAAWRQMLIEARCLCAEFSIIDLLRHICSVYFKEVRAGRLRPFFWSGQAKKPQISVAD